jgi:hypothetical protein
MPNHPRTVPKYNPKVADKFQKYEGVSPNDAALMATTMMDGANEEKGGGINATQTNCDVLKYDEALPESKGAKEGERRCISDLKSELGIKGKTKPSDIDDAVDDWIKNAEAKETKIS